MTIEQLLEQLVSEVNGRIRNGQLTERGLARKALLSQPHVHHILNGKRGLTPAVADRILRAIGLTMSELIHESRDPGRVSDAEDPLGDSTLVPLLEGVISPLAPAPEATLLPVYVPLPTALLAVRTDIAVARLGEDELMSPLFEAGDLVVIAKGLRPLEMMQEERMVSVVEAEGHWMLQIPQSRWWQEQQENEIRRTMMAERTNLFGTFIGSVMLLIRGLQPVDLVSTPRSPLQP